MAGEISGRHSALPTFVFVLVLLASSSCHGARVNITQLICITAAENDNATISCPVPHLAWVSTIVFASYGVPLGTCGSYTTNASCDAASTLSAVSALCLGYHQCTVPATNTLFGDPCGGVIKTLVIALKCSWTSSASQEVTASTTPSVPATGTTSTSASQTASRTVTTTAGSSMSTTSSVTSVESRTSTRTASFTPSSRTWSQTETPSVELALTPSRSSSGNATVSDPRTTQTMSHSTTPSTSSSKASVSLRSSFSVEIPLSASSSPRLSHSSSASATYVIPAAQRPPFITQAYTTGRTVATVGVLANPSVASASQVNRISLSGTLVVCEYQDGSLGFYNSPMNLAVGSGNVSYSIGAVLGNISVFFSFIALQLVIMIGYKLLNGAASYVECASAARFPSACVFPLLFVQQPTVTAAAVVFMYGEPEEVIWAAIGTTAGVSSWLFAFFFLRTTSSEAIFHPKGKTSEGDSALGSFFYGSGKWEDIDKGTMYKQRHQFLFGDYTDSCPWFILVEMSMNIVCGCIQGMVYPAFCYSLLSAAVGAFLLFTILAVYLRPYNSPWRAFVSLAMCVIQLAAATCSLVGVYYNQPSALSLSTQLGVVCFYFLLFQAVVELWPRFKTLRRLVSYFRGDKATRLVDRTYTASDIVVVSPPGTLLDSGGGGSFIELRSYPASDVRSVEGANSSLRSIDVVPGVPLTEFDQFFDELLEGNQLKTEMPQTPVVTLMPTAVEADSLIHSLDLRSDGRRVVQGNYDVTIIGLDRRSDECADLVL